MFGKSRKIIQINEEKQNEKKEVDLIPDRRSGILVLIDWFFMLSVRYLFRKTASALYSDKWR